jgi:hypothetical protein
MKMFQWLLPLFLLLAGAFGQSPYPTTYTQTVVGITNTGTSGTNIWKELGTQQCKPNSLTIGGDDSLWCVGSSDGYIYEYLNFAWVKQPSMGTNANSLAVGDANNIYSLQPTSACSSGYYQAFKWDGTTWNLTSAWLCASSLGIGSDHNFLLAVTPLLMTSIDGGVTWNPLYSSRDTWNYAAIADSSTICGVRGGQLYTLVSGSMVLYSPQPPHPRGAATLGCAITPNSPIYSQSSLLAWNGTGLTGLSLFDVPSSTWKPVTVPAVLSSVVATDPTTIYGLDSSNRPYHWNILTLYESGATTGSDTNCPGPSQPCSNFPGVTHTGTIQLKFPHSLGGQQVQQTVPPTTNMDISSWDVDWLCDPLENPNDPECAAVSFGQVTCSLGHTLASVPIIPPFPCILNLIPPKWTGWAHFVTIDVYVSNHWNSTEASDICTGISSWAIFNQNSYICHAGVTAPPAQGYTGRYIWVTYNPAQGPYGATNRPCGFYGTSTSECAGDGNGRLLHPWIDVGGFTDAQLTGAFAHEEGHDNYLNNCNWCQPGGSVMGGQASWQANQPTGPTFCDLWWSGIYYGISHL